MSKPQASHLIFKKQMKPRNEANMHILMYCEIAEVVIRCGLCTVS